jgi:predicted Fe-Mo cluster-binding NifX family protein
MKIAVPTRGRVVDNHFGHCEVFTVFTITDDNAVADVSLIPSPNGCGCKSNIAEVLRTEGVSIMLAGNMGDGALQTLSRQQIEVVRGCHGDAFQLVEAFLRNEILDCGESCSEHHQHHSKANGNDSTNYTCHH